MLWAYFDFSQLLIIWSGNLPEEISFYRTRLYGQWGIVAVIVLLFSFALPFFVLLSRDVKRNPNLISKVAIWMIVFAPGGFVLDDAPGIYPQRAALVARFCCARRSDQFVGRLFRDEFEAATAVAPGRSEVGGGHCKS